MDVKKLPFRCAHCRKFLADNECIVFQIPAAGESHICQYFDLDFSRIFPASENPFTAAFFHWCNTGIMSPGRNDLIKLIEIDPLRETVFDSNEWEQAKCFWLDWLIEKVFEYALQLMRVKKKTEKYLLEDIRYDGLPRNPEEFKPNKQKGGDNNGEHEFNATD